MIMLSPEKLKEMAEKAKPLAQFLKDNCHPHCTINVTDDRVELVEAIAASPL